MKKLTSLLITSILLIGAGACADVSKTSQNAPNTTTESPQAPSQETVQEDLKDAQSETRRQQLNADIRAREERNEMTGGDTQRAEDDLESEVSSKLEANIPNGQLTVEATEEGAVTVTGTVPNQDQLEKIDKLAREIKGVTSVNVKAVVAQAQPQTENNNVQ